MNVGSRFMMMCNVFLSMLAASEDLLVFTVLFGIMAIFYAIDFGWEMLE